VDLNNALSAIATNNAGSFEPNTTFAHMLWFDTNNDLMKVRNEANSAWVVVAKKDGSGWTPYRQGTALGTASVQPDNRYVHRTNNLNDIESRSRARANLRVIEDSSDPDFTNDPDRAARRGLVDARLSTLLSSTLPGLVDAELSTFPFSKEYQSTGLAMINGGLLTLAHGLSADPKLIRLYGIANTFGPGYSTGDKLDLTATITAYTNPATVRFDSTNIYIRNGYTEYTAAAPDAPDTTDFELYVEAYA
jgi:hypothetical protein